MLTVHAGLGPKKPLTIAVSLVLAGANHGEEAVAPASEDSTLIGEVVVVGIRESLRRSVDLKRNADGIIDAITAEDIGDFPDSNLAESLQRITGVSIDRERGEGARVTVRGFGPDFNLVLLNGRQMPTSSGLGRSFDFGNLASEGISAVEVYKTGQADVPTGGIGATMNIRTTRPLEAPGMNFTAAGSGLHDASVDDSGFTPEMSMLFSNTFAEDTVGIALSAVRQDRNNGANTANVGGWRTFRGEVDNCWCGIGPSEWGGIPPHTDPNQQNRPGAGDLYSVPQAIGYELAEYERLRTNGQLTLQWQASETLVATLDYTYSEVELEWYFGSDSYLSVGYFHKDVENFIGTSSVIEETFDLPHPALGTLAEEARAATGTTDSTVLYEWILENRGDAPGVDAENRIITGQSGRDPASPFKLTIPVNIEQATMKGWEFVVQRTFGDTGFGAMLNATIVDADVDYDNFSLVQQFVLTGLSDSANLVAFYENERFSVRVAYNWRDDFLAGTGQPNVGAGPPTHVAAYQQVDLSASYWVTLRMQVYLDVLNLTDETVHTYGRDKAQTLIAAQAGPRYNLGFRYRP